MTELIIISTSFILSTFLYLFLHRKTKISLKYLYIDNIFVSVLSSGIILFSLKTRLITYPWILLITIPFLVTGLGFMMTMIRFWRTPRRKVTARENEIVSPADGNIIYIKKIESGNVPLSVKKGVEASLDEFTHTDILNTPCQIIGINMTPFDVHKNCAPIAGEIILNKHFDGSYLSLKDPKAFSQNERNTIVLKNSKMQVGVVQTASRLVRRIDTYVKVGDKIEKGQWFGMIRFGSQVDLIIPQNCTVKIEVGQQIYAAKSIIASYENID